MTTTRPIGKIAGRSAAARMLVVATLAALTGAAGARLEARQVADPSADLLQGFTPDVSVARGQTVHFKIETTATAYSISIYRLDGAGMAASQPLATVPNPPAPQIQPPCLADPDAGIDCSNWSESASWAVPTDAVPGIYIALLQRPDTNTSTSIVFVVQGDAGN